MSINQPANTGRRDKTFNIRIDTDLYDKAMAKAEYGLGPAIRALLRAYVRGEIAIPSADMERELTSAPYQRRARQQRRGPNKRVAKQNRG